MNQTQMKHNNLLLLFICLFCQYAFAKATVYLDLNVSGSALTFTEKWLTTPKLYVDMMLPTKHPFRINDVVKFAGSIQNNAYFIIGSNIIKYKNIKYNQTKLVWFPFEITTYDYDCNSISESSQYWEQQNYFLFFTGARLNGDDYFQHCRIRFDSNIVLYSLHNKTGLGSAIQFKEVYKIKMHESKLTTNILGKTNIMLLLCAVPELARVNKYIFFPFLKTS